MNGVESFLHIGWIESDERIHSVLGAMNGFRLDLVKSPLGALLRETTDAQREDQSHSRYQRHGK